MSSTADFSRDLDREYNPRVQVPEFASYFARWKDTAHEVRRTIDARLDLADAFERDVPASFELVGHLISESRALVADYAQPDVFPQLLHL